MTSEGDGLKTNEFLRRRKLRLQQVREQSKDIAKKIRQRAKVENLRQVVELDSKKQKEYFYRQQRLVKQLEEYYAKGIENVGASHKNASEVRLQDDQDDKVDNSKQRGKEATAELRKKRQKILDQHKRLLDRKLQARETANELSREKSSAVVNKLTQKPTDKGTVDTQSKPDINSDKDCNTKQCDDKGRDMATQWELEEIPNDWEPNIPTLALPKDDNSVKEANNNNVDSKSDKSKRLDLFALSEEMPSSLRGGLTNQEERERLPIRPSLTLVSEYLQNRGLRLRETDATPSSKKTEDLKSLKQTILRTRTSREANANVDKTGKYSAQNSAVSKKNSVTMYNHSTRHSKDVPYNDERLVIRDMPPDDDAYSQAMRESTTSHSVDKDHKIQDIRSKVAMTKQSVEKEYKDTISFLNALPKDRGNKPIRTAFMDEQRQQMLKDSRQHKLQQEYRKIEKECAKHNCRNKPCRKSRTPPKGNGDVFQSTDIQYSWMPVPESDSNLAIHTIPTTLKEGKSGNTVKFSKVDSYHEYRSRHKHTPPTKDTSPDKPKRHIEAMDIQNSSDSETLSSNTSSSSESIRIQKKGKTADNLSDAERIIIYKISDSKADKRKRNSKLMKNIAKSLTLIDKQKESQETDSIDQSQRNSTRRTNSTSDNKVSFEQLNEGIYKTVTEKGDNIASMYFRDSEGERTAVPTDEPSQHRGACSCGLRSSGHQQTDTSRRCECGDKPPSPTQRSLSTCPRECKCGCRVPPKENARIAQPSAATSTSSFQTATNDKANSALSDGGFIKLIDDGGQEAGKFYIGASGFLKDDAYEVVIQLRKKGDDRVVSEKPENNAIVRKDQEQSSSDNKRVDPITVQVPPIDKERISPIDKLQVASVEAASTQTVSEENHEASHINIEPVPSMLSTVSEQPSESKKPGASFDVHFVSQVQKNPQQAMAKVDDSVTLIDNAIISDSKKVTEKGVSTVFQDQDTYTVPSNISKSEPTPRPATSTYTQTSMSSPNHRPVFFQMSSSTSTAYMSPPEMILPNFLRDNYKLTEREINDPSNFSNLGETDFNEENDYTNEYKCKCKKCTHVKKVASCKNVHATHQCRKGRHSLHGAKTPPNSDMSGRSGNVELVYQYKNKSKTAAPLSSTHKKSDCTCRKCASRDDDDSNKRKGRSISAAKHSSRNLIMRVSTSAASSKREGKSTSNESKTNLKPVIKNYVDQLLVLNRESLKAVQVIDKDCSAVTTPGSSIIEVPNNVHERKPTIENKLSLQQIQSMLTQKLIDVCEKTKSHRQNSHDDISEQNSEVCSKNQGSRHIKNTKFPRKKSVHKVKSLNISKSVSRAKKTCGTKKFQVNSETSSLASRRECAIENKSSVPSRNKFRSKSSPTPRFGQNPNTMDKRANSDLTPGKHNNLRSAKSPRHDLRNSETRRFSETSHRCTTTSNSLDSERQQSSIKRNSVEIPASISTQTSNNVDSEINFMKLAEDKLQNMEKIADLTEKCTQRLSNLAKVLEEVRKNKSLAYSQMSSASDSTSDSDKKSEKNVNKGQIPTRDTGENINNKSQLKSSLSTKKNTMRESDSSFDSGPYIPFLSDIPKPLAFKNLNSDLEVNSSTSSSKKSDSPSLICEDFDNAVKNRGKPPPALSRIHLKHVQDYVVPHELSTVVEVDSPMSVKLKSSRNDTKLEVDISNRTVNGIRRDAGTNVPDEEDIGDTNNNPNLPPNTIDISNGQKKSATKSSNKKIQIVDMKQFNEIMLKPFYSIQEYAKQCNVGALDDCSNLDDIIKDDHINEELSSLHSEASLPDVISELLKRNIISEPFKFDTGSNANSTTVSSESTISVLALSKARQGRNKPSVMFQNKENVGDSSDTLSISSNPDLENAFKKLGMGWASSTIKKTKERLALSSSSNTSSTSLSQFKVRSFNQDIPALVTESVSSVAKLSKMPQQNAADSSKNAEQQTSLSNSMTVKEFLTNELAKKITFNNKSKNDTEEEFVSLFETKMPEANARIIREENSIDNSTRSGNNNRARTSTPVQLFKSMTYHSSSSSNLSNGLFSNADDLSSVKVTSNSIKHSTSDKDDLIIPDFSLRLKRGSSDCSKSD